MTSKVHQDRTRVHQIKSGLGQRLFHNVVAPYFEVGVVQHVREARVDIGGQHVSGRTDALAQPFRDRSAATGHLQAPPARANAQRLEVSNGMRIMDRLKKPEPLARVAPVIPHRVVVLR